MQIGHWQVWLYSPKGNKLMDQFIHRNEAHHYDNRLGRLIGNPSLITVCFDNSFETNLPH